eukprot:Selendium_serpulae@DN3442_c0_g1_i1.p1
MRPVTPPATQSKVPDPSPLQVLNRQLEAVWEASTKMFQHVRAACIWIWVAVCLVISGIAGLIAAAGAYVLLNDCDGRTHLAKDKVDYFKGKKIWITGASSGIGRELAIELASRWSPAVLLLSGRNKAQLEVTAASCRTAGAAAASVRVLDFDMLDMAGIDSVTAKALQLCGGSIDVLFNNAGVGQRGALSQYQVDEKIFYSNFLSHLKLSKKVLESMIENNWGHIINTGSVQSVVAVPSRAAYCASKHAMHSCFSALALEFAALNHNVHVTQCLLGYAQTQLSMNTLLQDGSHPKQLDPRHLSGSHPRRVARLMLRAASNRMKECWITKHPFLAQMYMHRYCPDLAPLTGIDVKWGSQIVMSDMKFINQRTEYNLLTT